MKNEMALFLKDRVQHALAYTFLLVKSPEQAAFIIEKTIQQYVQLATRRNITQSDHLFFSILLWTIQKKAHPFTIDQTRQQVKQALRIQTEEIDQLSELEKLEIAPSHLTHLSEWIQSNNAHTLLAESLSILPRTEVCAFLLFHLQNMDHRAIANLLASTPSQALRHRKNAHQNLQLIFLQKNINPQVLNDEDCLLMLLNSWMRSLSNNWQATLQHALNQVNKYDYDPALLKRLQSESVWWWHQHLLPLRKVAVMVCLSTLMVFLWWHFNTTTEQFVDVDILLSDLPVEAWIDPSLEKSLP